jgi:hypothetical protein
MPLMSAVRSITAPALAFGLLAGLVGVVAGAGLAVTTIHLASTTTPQSASSATQAKGHGADVTAAVAKCKAALAPGQHGIGKCVSAIANKHGKSTSASASQGGTKTDDQDAPDTDTGSKP